MSPIVSKDPFFSRQIAYLAPGYGAVVPRSYYHNSGYYGFYRAPYYRGYWRGYYGGHYGYHHHGYYHGGHRW